MPADAARMVVGCKPAIFSLVYLLWSFPDVDELDAVDSAFKTFAAVASFMCRPNVLGWIPQNGLGAQGNDERSPYWPEPS